VTQEKSVVSCPIGTSHTLARWTKSVFSYIPVKCSVEAAGHYFILVYRRPPCRNYRENTQLLVLK
jgi:hypothetical protein